MIRSAFRPGSVGLFASPPFIYGEVPNGPWSGPLFEIVRDHIFFETDWLFSKITFEDVFEDQVERALPRWFLGIYRNSSRETRLWFSEPLFSIPIFAAKNTGCAAREKDWSARASAFVERYDFCSSRLRGPQFKQLHPHMRVVDYSYDGCLSFPPSEAGDKDLIFGDAVMLANRFADARITCSYSILEVWDWAPFCISCLCDEDSGRAEINDRVRACIPDVARMLDSLKQDVPALSLVRVG